MDEVRAPAAPRGGLLAAKNVMLDLKGQVIKKEGNEVNPHPLS